MRRAVLASITVLVLVAGCGGDDDPAPTFVTTTEPRDTSPIFTEDTTSSSDGVAGSDDPSSSEPTDTAADATTPTTNATASPTTSTGADPATTVRTDTSTPSQGGGGTTPTTVATSTATTSPPATGNDDFVVAAGTATINGTVEETVQVRARSGASGEVVVPVNKILDIFVAGPTIWDLDDDPPEDVMDVVDVDDVDDGPDDPFPETGGASIITLRPLTTGSTTLTVIDVDESDDPITVRVIAV